MHNRRCLPSCVICEVGRGHLIVVYPDLVSLFYIFIYYIIFIYYSRSQQTFSLKDQIVNICGSDSLCHNYMTLLL